MVQMLTRAFADISFIFCCILRSYAQLALLKHNKLINNSIRLPRHRRSFLAYLISYHARVSHFHLDMFRQFACMVITLLYLLSVRYPATRWSLSDLNQIEHNETTFFYIVATNYRVA